MSPKNWVDFGSTLDRVWIDVRSIRDRSGIDLGSLWDRFGVCLGSILGKVVVGQKVLRIAKPGRQNLSGSGASILPTLIQP